MPWVKSEYAPELAVLSAWIAALVPWSVTVHTAAPLGSVLFAIRFPLAEIQVRAASTVTVDGQTVRVTDVLDQVYPGVGVWGDAYLADPISAAATYETVHRDGSGEAAAIRRGLDRLAAFDADALVTYNGREFDLPFLTTRLEGSGESVDFPAVATDPDRHLDLYLDRKRRADRENVKWPSLGECLVAYDLPRPRTVLDGEAVTNTRFGEAVGPAYLRSLDGDGTEAERLRPAIDHYLQTDLAANVALYHADVGLDFEPSLLGTERSFSTSE